MRGKKIVLGVTGGIAAYKAAELTRLLIKAGVEVHIVLTEAATHFVGAATFQGLSGQPVWSDQWDARMANNMAHIDLSRNADAILVAPATADTIAKLAHGLADDLLSTLCLARDCPLLLAPAMNRQMWDNAATQRNVEILRSDGVSILGPAAGEQACGEVGQGRMLEPVELLEEVEAFFQAKVLAGKQVLITAGPTYEPIDPVRGLTNISSGKMGYALARACAQAGARVRLVSGPVNLPVPRHVDVTYVQSALQMRAQVMQVVSGVDVFISVAAVADYRPIQVAAEKIKKSATGFNLSLQPNPDILAEVAALSRPPFCIGFAAESGHLDRYAEEKRVRKRVPLVVGNLVQDGMGGDDNCIVLYDENGRHPLAKASKETLAHEIVAFFAPLLPS